MKGKGNKKTTFKSLNQQQPYSRSEPKNKRQQKILITFGSSVDPWQEGDGRVGEEERGEGRKGLL